MGDKRKDSDCFQYRGSLWIEHDFRHQSSRVNALHARSRQSEYGCDVPVHRQTHEGSSRPVFLILDGHPTHKAKKLRAHVESFQGNLRVFYLPAYAPQLNPDEHVWNEVKTHGVGRMKISGRDQLKAQSHRVSTASPEVACEDRGFFHAPSTRYAA